MTSLALGPDYRVDALRSLESAEFDILVVGGGVVGAGVALDAVSRGLKVGLVEARDWAAGTSSRSSKLIHGGLRYLEQKDFALVREALKERALLLGRLAPHLVKPVPFLLPLQHRLWERFYIGAGVTLYDTMGGAGALPRHRQLTRRAALQMAPGLREDSLVGGIQYYDAQVDDARHTMTIVRTAAQYGAQVVSSAAMVGYLREGERVVGATVRDVETGREFPVRARRVIAATGVWSDEAQGLAGAKKSFSVKASKGIHILVPRDRIELHTGLILRTEKSVLFVIPWGTHWIIGTTDTPYTLDKKHPAASAADIDYVLDHVNAVLRHPIGRDDIDGVYAGLRPLLSGDADDTARLSREHTVAQPAPGLVLVAGGKYTTYRVMAKDAVDYAVRDIGRQVPDSVTENVPIVGAVGYHVLRNQRHVIAKRTGLSIERIDHLLGRYGACIDEVLALVEQDPTLGQPVAGVTEYLRAEVVYAASHEGALHLEDVLTRRTRISVEEHDRGVEAAPEAARLMAGVLGWDEETVRREVEHYLHRVEAERAAAREEDEEAALEVRLSAGDLLDRYSRIEGAVQA